MRRFLVLALAMLLAACELQQPVGYGLPGQRYPAPGYPQGGYGLPPPTPIQPPGTLQPYLAPPSRPGVPSYGEDRPQPDRFGPDRAEPDRSGPDRAEPDRFGPDRAGPDDAAPAYPLPTVNTPSEGLPKDRGRGAGSPDILAPPPRPAQPAEADDSLPQAPPRVATDPAQPAPPAAAEPPAAPASRPSARTAAPSSSVPLLGFRPMRGQQGL